MAVVAARLMDAAAALLPQQGMVTPPTPSPTPTARIAAVNSRTTRSYTPGGIGGGGGASCACCVAGNGGASALNSGANGISTTINIVTGDLSTIGGSGGANTYSNPHPSTPTSFLVLQPPILAAVAVAVALTRMDGLELVALE